VGSAVSAVGLVELFVAVLITGVSCVNAAPPVAAWRRSGEARFLLVSGANGFLALLGALWTWGQLPWNPPSWTPAPLPILAVTLLAVMLFLAATLWPRRA